MSVQIVTKNSSTAGSTPAANALVEGELAINVKDQKIFSKDGDGNVFEFGANMKPSENLDLQGVTDNGNFTNNDVLIGNTSASPNIELKGSDGSINVLDGKFYFSPSGTGAIGLGSTLDWSGKSGAGVYMAGGPRLALVGGGSSSTVFQVGFNGNESTTIDGAGDLFTKGEVGIGGTSAAPNIELNSSGVITTNKMVSAGFLYVNNSNPAWESIQLLESGVKRTVLTAGGKISADGDVQLGVEKGDLTGTNYGIRIGATATGNNKLGLIASYVNSSSTATVAEFSGLNGSFKVTGDGSVSADGNINAKGGAEFIGSVAIGSTVNPVEKLHVSTGASGDAGEIGIALGSHTASARMASIVKNTSGPYELNIYSSNHPTASSGDIVFGDLGKERVRFASDGNVKIGGTTSAPNIELKGSDGSITAEGTFQAGGSWSNDDTPQVRALIGSNAVSVRVKGKNSADSNTNAFGVFRGGSDTASQVFGVQYDGSILGPTIEDNNSNSFRSVYLGNSTSSGLQRGLLQLISTFKASNNSPSTTSALITANNVKSDGSTFARFRLGMDGSIYNYDDDGNVAVRLISDGSISTSGDITCTDNTKGLVLMSPNGTAYRLTVANDGTLSTTAA